MIPVLIAIALTVLVQIIARNLAPPEKKVERLDATDFTLCSSQFKREINVLLGAPIVSGNRIEVLNNGVEIFPAMIAGIKSAQHSICFETFIYWSGDVGEEVAEALAERARNGVEVKVLIDWLGSKILGSREEKILRDAGVDLEIYRPLNWYHISRINHRTHRKILVIDGKTGFTGGVGIADQWKGDVAGDGKDEQWRDFHFRVEGPIVAQLQSVFVNNWVKATGLPLHGEHFFPEIPNAGDHEIQCFHSSPTEGAESVRLMFLYMIETAGESVDIGAAYFVPDEMMRKALISATQRGVTVRVILPGENNDERAVTHASRELWGELLEAGVQIHRFLPSMFHCKIVIADRKLASVGSANFDNRSFRLNDEMNLNVYDEDFALQMTKIFEEDLRECSRVSLETWQNRPLKTKLLDFWFRLFRRQL
ncbi:cardiolipin synthase [Verrucomicrobiaceae bacterium 227]